MSQKNLKTNRRGSAAAESILVAVCALALFPVAYLDNMYPTLSTLYTWAPLVAFCFCCLHMIANRVELYLDSFTVGVGAFCVVLMSVSLLSAYSSTVYSLQLSCRYMALILLCIIVCKSDRSDRLIKVLFSVFFLYTVANTITVFLFPNSMYQNNRGWDVCWLLGGDNFAVRYYILTVLFALLSDMGNAVRPRSVLALINYGVYVFVRFCGMGIIIFLILSAMMTPFVKERLQGKARLFHVFVAGVVAFAAVVVFGQSDVFTPILDLLGKDATLSARTRIWQTTFELLQDHLMLGYGALRGSAIEILLYFPGMTNVHNTFLTVFLFGGVVLCSIFVFILFKVSTWADARLDPPVLYVFIACCLALVFHAQVEGNYIEILFLAYALPYYMASDSEKKYSAAQLEVQGLKR